MYRALGHGCSLLSFSIRAMISRSLESDGCQSMAGSRFPSVLHTGESVEPPFYRLAWFCVYFVLKDDIS